MRFLTLALILLLSGCSLLNPDKGEPEFKATPSPEIGTPDETGRVVYTPSIPSPDLLPSSPDTPAQTEHCRVFEQTEKIGPEEIGSNIIQGVYKTVAFSREEAPLPVLRTADHVHLSHLEIVSVAGDDFSFLSWMEAYLVAEGQDDKLVAWGSDLDSSGYLMALEIDGETDLASYVQDNIRLEGFLRAQSPSTKTWLTASIGFVVFTDCEWR